MALLLSVTSFEDFYGRVMHLTCEQYLSSYRNDFAYMYAKSLGSVDVDVVIYIPAWGCEGLHQIDRTISVRFLSFSSWYATFHRLSPILRTSVGRYVSQFANARGFEPSLKRALLEDRISTLYVQEYWTARFDYLVRTMNLPVVGSDHGGVRLKQLTVFKRKSFHLASAITCQTTDEVSQVRAYGIEPVFLPNGIDTDTFVPEREAKRQQTILIVARFTDKQKRVSDLIRAMPHLPLPWTLQIAGTGPDEGMLRTLAKDAGVEARVDFLGFISNKASMRQLYQHCGVFSMPSYREGLPLAILEAMSCGCSVVTTDIRGFDMVKNGVTGHTVPVGEPEQLARAIEKAWEQREAIGVRARALIKEHYSLNVMVERLLGLLSDERVRT